MGPLEIGVVHPHHVAFSEIVAIAGDRGFDADVDVADEDRHAGRLAKHVAVAVEHGNSAVAALVDDRRECRAIKRGVHVLGTGDDEVADDLGGDGVGGAGFLRLLHFHSPQRRVIIMWPPAPILARQPSGRMVVAVGSSMIAGPATAAPDFMPTRSTILVFSGLPPKWTARCRGLPDATVFGATMRGRSSAPMPMTRMVTISRRASAFAWPYCFK